MRKRVIVVLSMTLVILMIGFVSAQTIDQALSSFLISGEGLIKFLIGDISGISGATAGEVFFIKLLVFFLLLSVISLVLYRVPLFEDKHGIAFIVAIIVSLIAVRYITNDALINFIWLPYGVLGVFLSSILPFIIGFYFLMAFDEDVIRKVGWVSFTVIFLILGISRWDDFATAPTTRFLFWTVSEPAWYQNLALVYIVIGIISGLLIFFDKDIRAMMVIRGLSKASDENARLHAAHLSHEIAEARKLLGVTSDAVSIKNIRAGIKDREKRIKRLLRG